MRPKVLPRQLRNLPRNMWPAERSRCRILCKATRGNSGRNTRGAGLAARGRGKRAPGRTKRIIWRISSSLIKPFDTPHLKAAPPSTRLKRRLGGAPESGKKTAAADHDFPAKRASAGLSTERRSLFAPGIPGQHICGRRSIHHPSQRDSDCPAACRFAKRLHDHRRAVRVFKRRSRVPRHSDRIHPCRASSQKKAMTSKSLPA